MGIMDGPDAPHATGTDEREENRTMGTATAQPTARVQTEYTSVTNLAKLFGVSRRHVLDLAHEGELAHIRIGNVLRFPLTEVERLRAEGTRRTRATE